MFRPHPISRFEVTLEKTTDRVDGVRDFYFSKPQGFIFTPGQFITLFFEKNDEKFRRQYSIFSTPSDSHIILSVKYIEGGPGSEYLWSLKIGDTIQAMGPLGVFVVREEHKGADLLFIGTGTGLVPFISMIKDMAHSYTQGKLIVFAGHRYNPMYDADLKEFVDEGLIEYQPIISRPKAIISNKGRVTDLVKAYDFSDFNGHIYICGLYVMIEDVRQLLLEKGIDPTCIHFERYD